MANTTLRSTASDNLVVLPPKVQRLLTSLREARNLAAQAKVMGDENRKNILDFFGEILDDVVGVDAKGKRLVSITLVESSRSIDLDALQKDNPEIYTMLVKSGYIVEKGKGKPTPRINLL